MRLVCTWYFQPLKLHGLISTRLECAHLVMRHSEVFIRSLPIGTVIIPWDEAWEVL